MGKIGRRLALFLLIALFVTGSTGCAGGLETEQTEQKEQVQQTPEQKEQQTQQTQIEGLTFEGSIELSYAEGFALYKYQDGYELIEVQGGARYLLVPEEKEIPDNLEEDIVVLKKPLDHIYLAATSAMALFDAIDSIGSIRLSGTDAKEWYIENAVSAMERGDILFAGKYSEPDYEMLIDEECDLAVESTMILHSPKVQEMIEELGIPVFIDRSSYEKHPLGRTEWIKLYGAMTDKEEEADAFFEEQAKVIEELKDFPNTEKTVAFFYVNTDGSVVVRKKDDYIPSMIEIAGGRYVFDRLENQENQSAAVKLTMEEFYATAVDADYLIYNAAIDNPLTSLEELTAKGELFSEFKAVKNGNVWCTGKYLYQATDTVGRLIMDIHLMLTEPDAEKMSFLYHVE